MDKSTRYKIFNDPVHGFISIPKGIILQLIDHPYVQRLRRIRQLGLGYLVFPAAEHSRFSHALGALEHSLLSEFNHEMMSLAIMHELNKQFDGALSTAIEIFTDHHPKKFLHQLVSSQLDLDRLDYLKRDSFFTGVSEGSVGIQRILKTLRVHKNNIVIGRGEREIGDKQISQSIHLQPNVS